MFPAGEDVYSSVNSDPSKMCIYIVFLNLVFGGCGGDVLYEKSVAH